MYIMTEFLKNNDFIGLADKNVNVQQKQHIVRLEKHYSIFYRNLSPFRIHVLPILVLILYVHSDSI